jgi:hypothetical protein
LGKFSGTGDAGSFRGNFSADGKPLPVGPWRLARAAWAASSRGLDWDQWRQVPTRLAIQFAVDDRLAAPTTAASVAGDVRLRGLSQCNIRDKIIFQESYRAGSEQRVQEAANRLYLHLFRAHRSRAEHGSFGFPARSVLDRTMVPFVADAATHCLRCVTGKALDDSHNVRSAFARSNRDAERLPRESDHEDGYPVGRPVDHEVPNAQTAQRGCSRCPSADVGWHARFATTQLAEF